MLFSEMDEDNQKCEPQKAPPTDRERIATYCSAFEFHLRLRDRFPVSRSNFDVKPLQPAPDLWFRLVTAASLRKFISGSDHVYLSKVVTSLCQVNAIEMSSKQLERFRTQIKGLRTGSTGVVSIQIDGGTPLNAFQVIEHLLHTNYIHADSDREQDLWSWDESALNFALWEGTESLIPLMTAVYLKSCEYLEREPVSLAEGIGLDKYHGINETPPSEFETAAQKLVDDAITRMQASNQGLTGLP